MTLRLVGAGLGRTGTHSLKIALERLLGGGCYHMLEVFEHPEHVALWQRAVRGDALDWEELLSGYVATVDWPAAAFWRELCDASPEAVVLLSVRDDAATWWRSADQTIFQSITRAGTAPAMAGWHEMVLDLLGTRFTDRWQERDAAIDAYERHNHAVRSSVPPDRLVEWRPGDGWGPICAALDVPVPDEPFPHVNTTAEFRAMTGLDAPGG